MNGKSIEVIKRDSFPDYSGVTQDGDYAILTLAEPVTNDIGGTPACLLPEHEKIMFYQKEEFTVTGFGSTWPHEGTRVLLEANVTALTNDDCDEQITMKITENMMCAWRYGKDTCRGDSGGNVCTKLRAHTWAWGVTPPPGTF
jgi:hypothetical protein